jgi:hypothetical protein
LLNDAYEKAANGQKREERERRSQDAKTRPPLHGSSAVASSASVRESENEREKLESFVNLEPVTKEARQAKEARGGTQLILKQIISSFMQQLDQSIPLESVTLRDLKQAVMPHFDNWVLFFFCKGLGFS